VALESSLLLFIQRIVRHYVVLYDNLLVSKKLIRRVMRVSTTHDNVEVVHCCVHHACCATICTLHLLDCKLTRCVYLLDLCGGQRNISNISLGTNGLTPFVNKPIHDFVDII
jgi:hypothetical protein